MFIKNQETLNELTSKTLRKGKTMSRVDEMIKGYGPGFPSLEELFATEPSEADRLRLESPIPALGRYLRSVKFLNEVTSGKAVGILRFKIITRYFTALSVLMRKYQGIHAHQKIIGPLSDSELSAISEIGKNIKDVLQAERIEKFTEHDTAAAGDFVKLRIAHDFPHLTSSIEGVHFACTSEDVMGNVFGLIANNLVFKHFLGALLDFCASIINFTEKYEVSGPLLLPALTHQQAAEPITLGKKNATRLRAIDYLIGQMWKEDGSFQPFSGKMGGGGGNLICHYAAYSDIDWRSFAKDFVEDLGLHYEEMTDQCVSYVVEVQHFCAIANILTQIIKLTKDFVNMASCPSQFFVKEKKKGVKASSLMPNKCNAWGMEGAIRMLVEARTSLLFLAQALPDYPHEGDMGRSYLFRNVGNCFMPIFIALARITSEMSKYHPNPAKITAFFDEYPGMAGSSIQTVLKRMGIASDAYRAIQEIAINPDGTYANQEQFRQGLEKKMGEFDLPEDSRRELRALLNPANLVGPAHQMVQETIKTLKDHFEGYRRGMEEIKTI